MTMQRRWKWALVLLVAVLVGGGTWGGIVWREAHCTALLEGNLKALTAAIRAYARDAPREMYPPLVNQPGVLFLDAALLYPGYLADPTVWVSPRQPGARALRQSLAANPDPTALTTAGAASYYYLGYLVENEVVGAAFVRAYREAAASGETDDGHFFSEAQLAVAFPDAYDGPRVPRDTNSGQWREDHGPGNAGSNSIQHLREGVERYLIWHVGPATAMRGVSVVPLIIERPVRIGDPIRVGFLDERVREVPFGEFPNDGEFLTALEALSALEARDQAD